jgi:ABC-type multidrug transport system permease subunit
MSALTAYDYIEHTHEMSYVNRATNTLSIGLSIGYTLFLAFMYILLLITTYVMSSDTHM